MSAKPHHGPQNLPVTLSMVFGCNGRVGGQERCSGEGQGSLSSGGVRVAFSASSADTWPCVSLGPPNVIQSTEQVNSTNVC